MECAACEMRASAAYNRRWLHSVVGFTGGMGVTSEIGDFLDYLTYERNASINTVSAYRDDLESFVAFLSDDCLTVARDQLDLRRVDHRTIRASLAHLAGRKLGRASIARHLSTLRSFFKYLVRESVVEANPARAVATPKLEKHLPSVMQPSDVALLLEQPDLSTSLGLRDRAFLELLYGPRPRTTHPVHAHSHAPEFPPPLVKVRSKGA